MTRVIPAVYTKGVFKPLARVKLHENQAVSISITDVDLKSWNKEMDALLRQVHRGTRKFSSKEIEADITAALKEVRRKK